MSIVQCLSVNKGGLSECETLQECAHHVGQRSIVFVSRTRFLTQRQWLLLCQDEMAT